MDIPEVSKHPDEDLTPLDVDDGALNAYVLFERKKKDYRY